MAPECQSKGLVTYGGGGPQVGEITRLSNPTYHVNVIKL